jgi:hypothetical protein
MGYEEMVETIVNRASIVTVLIFLLAGLGIFLAVGQAIKLWRDLKKPKGDEESRYSKHISDAEERFQRGERKMDQNTQDITDLKEGQRVTCVAIMALLNHSLHDGNDKEMLEASDGLNKYLINRK